MTDQQIDNLTTYLNVLLKEHRCAPDLGSYNAIVEQLEMINKLSEEFIIEYVEQGDDNL